MAMPSSINFDFSFSRFAIVKWEMSAWHRMATTTTTTKNCHRIAEICQRRRITERLTNKSNHTHFLFCSLVRSVVHSFCRLFRISLGDGSPSHWKCYQRQIINHSRCVYVCLPFKKEFRNRQQQQPPPPPPHESKNFTPFGIAGAQNIK